MRSGLRDVEEKLTDLHLNASPSRQTREGQAKESGKLASDREERELTGMHFKAVFTLGIAAQGWALPSGQTKKLFFSLRRKTSKRSSKHKREPAPMLYLGWSLALLLKNGRPLR